MVTIKILAYCFLALEALLFFIDYRKGLGAFLFIYVVFPDTLKLVDYLNLNINRAALFIAILFFINEFLIKKRINKSPFPLAFAVLLFSLLILPSYLFAPYSDGFPRGIYSYLLYFFADTFLPGIIIYYSIQSLN